MKRKSRAQTGLTKMPRKSRGHRVSRLKLALGNAARENKMEEVEAALLELQDLVESGVLDKAQTKRLLEQGIIIAAKRGHTKTVLLLIDGGCKLGCKLIQDSLLLLLNAGLEFTEEAVRELVKHGANVNCVDSDGDSLLFRLCSSGSPGMVKLLIELGATVDLVNSKRQTPLFSVYGNRFSIEVAKTLLKNGASPCHTSANGETPLHIAITKNNVSMVQTFLKGKEGCMAADTANPSQLSPIFLAVFSKAEECLDLFLNRPEITKQTRVDALELAWAAFSPKNPGKALQYLRKAMRERTRSPILAKPEIAPAAELGGLVECQTEAELRELTTSSLRKQSYMAAERILGANHPMVGTLLQQHLEEAVEESRWNDGLELWRHGRKPLVWRHLSKHLDNKLLAILLQMCDWGMKPSFQDCHSPLHLLVQEMEQHVKDGAGSPFHFPKAALFKYYVCLVYAAVASVSGMEDSEQLHDTLTALVKILPEFTQSSVFHHILQVSNMSNPQKTIEVFECFVKCRVDATKEDQDGNSALDVTKEDQDGNSALHLAVQLPPNCHRQVINSASALVKWFLDQGAHEDAVNKAGLTPLDMASAKELKDLLTRPPTLRCLATRKLVSKGYFIDASVDTSECPKLFERLVRIHSARKQ